MEEGGGGWDIDCDQSLRRGSIYDADRGSAPTLARRAGVDEVIAAGISSLFAFEGAF